MPEALEKSVAQNYVIRYGGAGCYGDGKQNGQMLKWWEEKNPAYILWLMYEEVIAGSHGAGSQQ